jgi:hypothetical protein
MVTAGAAATTTQETAPATTKAGFADSPSKPTDTSTDLLPDEGRTLVDTVVTLADANATYRDGAVTLRAEIAADHASHSPVNEGFVIFTVTKGSDLIGKAVSGSVSQGVATASFALEEIPTGTYAIHAVYEAPSSAMFASSRVASTRVLTVAKAGTTLTVASSSNPSIQGSDVTFTAVITAPGAGSVKGTVHFFREGEPGAIGSAPIAVVGGTNVATFTTSRLPRGGHTITAVFEGDDNLGGSTARLPVTQTVSSAKSASKQNRSTP